MQLSSIVSSRSVLLRGLSFSFSPEAGACFAGAGAAYTSFLRRAGRSSQ
jgi:hypothetical protein